MSTHHSDPTTTTPTTTLTAEERAVVVAFGIHDADVLNDLEYEARA